MSLGSGPMSPKRWRPLEQMGWFIGIMAGVVVLACVWIFAIVQHLVGMVLVPANADRQER